MAISLHKVKLAPVGRLLSDALPGVAFAVRDCAGRVVWQCDVDGLPAAGADHLCPLEATLRKRRPRQAALAEGRTQLEQPLDHPAQGALGTLLALLPENVNREMAAALLAAAGECITQLAAQEDELVDMALELGTRYEELNLLYTLDEAGNSYDPRLGRDALQRMTADVGAFLDVAEVSVYSPAENLDICVRTDAGSGVKPPANWPEVRDRVLGFITERDGAVVINTRADRLRMALLGGLRIKLLAVPLRDLQGRVSGLLCLVKDQAELDFSNSDRKLLEVLAELSSRIIQASYDSITGLLNRHGFGLRAGELLAEGGARELSVLYLNLDSFRLVNDSAGRGAGDSLLRRLATLLRVGQPRGGAVAHLGSDEFAVLFTGGESVEAVRRQAAMLQGALAAQGFVFDGKRFDCSVCAGLARGCGGLAELPALLLAAEAACRVAKRYGRGQFRVYDPADDQYIAEHRQADWGPRITEALASNQFTLYAQPIVPLAAHGAVSHYEVLLRLREPDGRIVAPGAFIPAAERYSLMPRVDRMVVEGALDFLTRAARRGHTDGVNLAVNISGQSLVDGEFLGFVVDAVAAAGVPFGQLCFEITETVAVADFEAAVRFIDSLRRRGSRISLDDFGSGLSSFGYLRRLPVDFLKIDGQIVRDMATDRVNFAMVEAIHRIGAEMKLRTIAEFVEDEAIIAALRHIGVDYAQGYVFGRPAPLEQVLETAGEPVPLVAGVTR